LIDGAARRNDLAAATGAGTPAGGPSLDVDPQLYGYIFQFITHPLPQVVSDFILIYVAEVQ
jgi:hypothetical protein